MQKRSITPIGLLLTSVSAIIGSGWLFSAFYSAKLAGPSAILSWIIGGFAVICIAFVFAELCAMLPITGSSTRIPLFTHGTLVSFLFAWIIWLSYVSLAPTEVQAVIQYLRFYFPNLTNSAGQLSSSGYLTATILMFIISVINVYSIRWLIKFNSLLTVIKLFIPVLLSIILIVLYFSPQDLVHPHGSPFMPFGSHGLLYALAVGGIIFAFNGFKQAAEMAGEAKNPGFALPFAIVGSVVVCLIIFLLLQIGFLSALTPSNLLVGWDHLNLPGDTSPFASILQEHDLTLVLPLLYFGAVVAPLAAGLMYIGSSARSLYGISKNKQLPAILRKLNNYNNPGYAIGVNFIIGMFMFAPLPGWDKMVGFLTSLLAITYGIGPINLLSLRKQMPERSRPFYLPKATIWATFAFYICNLLAYWSGWDTISKLSIALLCGVLVLVMYRIFSPETRKINLNWREASWLWPYLCGLTLLSYLGTFGNGKGIMPFGWDFLFIAIFSVFIMYFAVKVRLSNQQTKVMIDELKLTDGLDNQ